MKLFSDPDLILLHAPSIYDFRDRPSLLGPVSDVVPSTQVFDMYPIGFLTMLACLQEHGFSARIINIALRMLGNRRFDVERCVRRLRPRAFGIDLHWLVHAQGSLALARVVKRHHPDIPVIFGGLSASYFHEELAAYEQVDYVLRGDSTEEPLLQLMAAIRARSPVDGIPGLTWKDGGRVRVNPAGPAPADLNAVSFDYRTIMRSSVRHLDPIGHLPFRAWARYPIVAALSCRGCVHNCAICGGSASAYRLTGARNAPAFRDPERMACDMAAAARHIKAPIIVLGDPLQAGEDYARRFFAAAKGHRIRNHVALEFFAPPSSEMLELAADTFPRFNIQMSPESHDERIRRMFGRPYGNAELERFVAHALNVGCRRLDLFFMIGIPGQTPDSAMDTVAYCRTLLETCGAAGHAGKLRPFISPLAPFLDPGSRAFENPDEHGYRLFHRTLEEHRTALLAPSWKYTLNYETRWMSRDEIVDTTYRAALELNAVKAEFGLLSAKEARRIEARIRKESELCSEIDGIVRTCDEPVRTQRVRDAVHAFDTTGGATICKKNEMNWPVGLLRFNYVAILRALIRWPTGTKRV